MRNLDEITFFAGFDDGLEANFSEGSTGVKNQNGNPIVENGYLKLGDTSEDWVEWDGEGGNAENLVWQGTISQVFVPQYDDSPANNQRLFSMQIEAGAERNQIQFEHATDNDINYKIMNGRGSLITSTNIGQLSATSGQHYHLSFDFDFSIPETRFFLDGEQLGTTARDADGRYPDIKSIRVGTAEAGTQLNANFWVDRLALYETMQHRGPYTPDQELETTIIYSYIQDLISQRRFSENVRLAFIQFELNDLEQNSGKFISPNFPYSILYNEDGFGIGETIATEAFGGTVDVKIVTENIKGERSEDVYKKVTIPNREAVNLTEII